ncbi:MAG: hypothetical protein CfP315_0573 [Candidatus Improbicoccus pseudotrichonymphae]|uniref:Uncharacterized protein n=1 Tax=Candidatus Improbicoccus pseudotrichonymphae TaxID=3033792 RepID=A0AA48IGZ8_9FIRM|nr:MAG: hypothetical protein CfP315_0573 [Candidatus Improbicoccus pseudotrichonymphae]
MKKESNGIGENKNSKKISKNNKIISSILAVAMCCQSFVVDVKPDSQLVNTVEIMKYKDEGNEDENDVKENDEDENDDKSKKGDMVDKSKELLDLAETIAVVGVLGVGVLVVYNAIKVVYNAIKTVKIVSPKTVKIGNIKYQTYNIGKGSVRDDGKILFENLLIGYSKDEYFMGIYGFSFGVGLSSGYSPGVVPNCKSKSKKLSSYSEFIFKIIQGGDSLSTYLKTKNIDENNMESVVLYACKLLEKLNDPEFRLVNVYVKFKFQYVHFPIPVELMPYLKIVSR